MTPSRSGSRRRRVAAAVLDFALFIPVAAVLVWVTVRWYGEHRSSTLLVTGLASAFVTDVYVVAGLLWLSNVVVLVAGRRTFGQRLQRLRLVRSTDGSLPGSARVMGRQVVRLLEFVLALPLWIGIGFVIASPFDNSGLDVSFMSGVRGSYGWFLVALWLPWILDVVSVAVGERSVGDRLSGTMVVDATEGVADDVTTLGSGHRRPETRQ